MPIDYLKDHERIRYHIMFTHIEEGTGKNTHFDVTEITEWLANLIKSDKKRFYSMCHNVVIDPVVAESYAKIRGIEPHRYDRLTAKCVEWPVLFCMAPDGSATLVDGNHRFVWLARHGYKTIRSIVVPEPDWRPFEVINFHEMTAEDTEKIWSGIA